MQWYVIPTINQARIFSGAPGRQPPDTNYARRSDLTMRRRATKPHMNCHGCGKLGHPSN